MEFSLLWAVLTAVALGWLGLRIWDEGLGEHPFDRLLGAGVAGLAAGRLAAMLIQGVNPLTNPADIIVVRGGVNTGVAAGVFTATLLWTTRTTRGAADALAPTTLLALAGWHAGCLWRDACLGAPSDLPWTWALEDGTVTRHPVEVYAAIGIAMGAWLVSKLGWRLWLRSGTALSIAAAIRLLTEPLRPSITGGPVWWYLAGVVAGGLLVAFGPRITRSPSRAPT